MLTIALCATQIAIFPGGGASQMAEWLADGWGGLAVVASSSSKPWPEKTFEYTDEKDFREQLALFTDGEVGKHAIWPHEYPSRIADLGNSLEIEKAASVEFAAFEQQEGLYTIRPPKSGYAVLRGYASRFTGSAKLQTHWSLARWPIAVVAKAKSPEQIGAAIAEAVGGTYIVGTDSKAARLELDSTEFRNRASELAKREARHDAERQFQLSTFASWTDGELAKAMEKPEGGRWQKLPPNSALWSDAKRYFETELGPEKTTLDRSVASELLKTADWSDNPQIVFESKSLRFSVAVKTKGGPLVIL